MSLRYLFVVGHDNPADEQMITHVARVSGLPLAFASGRISAFATPACPCLPIGESGCIVGSLFHRHGIPEAVHYLTLADQTSISKSVGQHLLDRFWGGYVAAIATGNSIKIVRDPSGLLSCYYARCDRHWLIASDAELLVNAGLATGIDLEEIGCQLFRASVPVSSTALRGVQELMAGFAMRLSSLDARQESCWSPWDHVAARDERSEDMAMRLAPIVLQCTRAWSSNRANILLSVSGGLDSSILAACLARMGANATCLTMFTEDPIGDERVYARTLCDHLGLPLIERPYRLEDIDITEPLAAHLPRPRDRTQANAYERVHIEVAREIGAHAFMTGDGGDNVLGYSQSAAPVADRYLFEGLGCGVFATLMDVCRQTGCNIPDAVKQAWRFAHHASSMKATRKPLLLDRDFVRALDVTELRHPWMDAPVGALPGKAAHVASVLRVQTHLESARAYYLPVISAFASQPIIEACLSIPSWEWRAGGRDRAVARRAFSSELPAIIVNRTVKGSPSGFGARLFDYFRASIRDRLLGGRLAAHRIVDTAVIEQIIAGEKPVPHAERVRMLELVNAEAWIDHWVNVRELREQDELHVKLDARGSPPI